LKTKRWGFLALTGIVLAAPLSVRAQDASETATIAGTTSTESAAAAPDVPQAPLQTLTPELGGDGRRTLGRLVPNLGRNFVGVFSRDNLRPLLFGAALTGAAAGFLDQPANSYVVLNRPIPKLGSVGQTAGGAGVIAPLSALMFVAGRASHDTRFRAATYDALQATIVTTAYTFGLKETVQRTRPDGSDKLSFPSGHAANAFAWAAIADRYYGKKAGIAAYTAAGLIGLSRVDHQKHNVSDVLAGATLGYIVGRTVVRRDDEAVRHSRQVFVAPATDAQGSGLGLQVSVQF
jgi:membrane-associated phospholipid phosphatase